MSNRSAGLVVDFYATRFNATHAPAAGTTCTASVSAVNPSAKVNLATIGFSVRNHLAASTTFTLSVRDASIAGTVLASWDWFLAAGTSATDTWNDCKIQGLRGNAIVAEFGAPNASVVQKVTIAGWHDALNQ